MCGAPASDCLDSYPGHSLRKSYQSAELQLVYSTVPAKRDRIRSKKRKRITTWKYWKLKKYLKKVSQKKEKATLNKSISQNPYKRDKYRGCLSPKIPGTIFLVD